MSIEEIIGLRWHTTKFLRTCTCLLLRDDGVVLPDGKEDDDRAAEVEGLNALPSERKDEPHFVTDLDCANHGGPTDQRVVDKVAFRSNVPRDALHLGPTHPLVDPTALDGIKRFPTIDPDRRRGVERDLHGWCRCRCRTARHPTLPAPTSHAPQPIQFPRAPAPPLPIHLHARP